MNVHNIARSRARVARLRIGENSEFDVLTRDYREIVIEDLADENVLLRERIGSLEADVGTYREIANAALDALVHVTQQNERLRNDYQEQSDAYRWLCQEILLRAGADEPEAR